MAGIVVFSDGCDQKRAEAALDRTESKYRDLVEELRLSEANCRALMDNATCGICRITGGGSFLTVNPALIEILGFESERHLLGTTAMDIFADPESIAQITGRICDPDDTEPVETIWKRSDGKSIAVRLSGRAVWDSGVEAECLEMIVEDVSSQRDLQDQLRQAQKMETLGQLTGGVAHDFNNVLSVILANSQLLAAALEADNSPFAADARDIEAAAARAAAVVKKLMSISRQTELRLEPTDLGKVVADITAMMRSVLPENIAVDIAVPDRVPAALTDASAVEQMLLNLATNARDAMPQGGKINIEVTHEHVDPPIASERGIEARGDFVRIAVSDTGIGMDASTRARIFEPFFTTKSDGKGTGLGLAMVSGLMQQLRGFSKVDSTPGQGTTIALYFPATERCTESAAACEVRIKPLKGRETILLVDDEIALRRAGRRTLERFGYKVLEADNGEGAIALCRDSKTNIDLIISDLMMPKMDGQQLRNLVENEALEIKFMFTTGYSDGDPFARSAQKDGIAVLHKPWTINELLHQVRSVLDGSDLAA